MRVRRRPWCPRCLPDQRLLRTSRPALKYPVFVRKPETDRHALEQIRLRWNRLMPSKPVNLLVIF
ncbi:hypothetical protein CHELA40_30208 [Chelatococcus asaccharovorans]|nr:hypothetical protein CHELA40_30208 [Chelatococcus asaccharovorans]